MSKDGMVKATAVYTRALTERARQIHHTSPVATAALGRALAGVSMMGNALKGSGESVTLQIKGDGPLGTILAVSDAEGNVRGYVQDASVELPLRADGKLDVGSAVGHGAGNIHGRLINTRIDNTCIRSMQALAERKLSGTAYFQPRSDLHHGRQQKWVGFDGIAKVDFPAPDCLNSAHAGLQSVSVKDKRRCAVGGSNFL